MTRIPTMRKLLLRMPPAHALRTFATATAMLWCTANVAVAAGLTADEIIHNTNRASYYQGADARAQVSMSITDSQGRTRKRRFTVLRHDAANTDAMEGHAYRSDQKFYIYFQRPADVSKMVFMVWKHLESDDDRWLYLPALDLVKRIATSDKRTSFVGSDFFYEDVSGRNIDDDVHELVNTTDNFYVMKSTPKVPGPVEFSAYQMYLHRSTFLPVQIEYFDKGGKKYRVYKALKVETVGGFPTVIAASMENLATGSKTVMEYNDVVYDVGLPDSIFAERYLRRAPSKFLR